MKENLRKGNLLFGVGILMLVFSAVNQIDLMVTKSMSRYFCIYNKGTNCLRVFDFMTDLLVPIIIYSLSICFIFFGINYLLEYYTQNAGCKCKSAKPENAETKEKETN